MDDIGKFMWAYLVAFILIIGYALVFENLNVRDRRDREKALTTCIQTGNNIDKCTEALTKIRK